MSDHTLKLKDLITAKLNYMGASNPDEPLYEIDDVETFYNQLVDSKINNKFGSSVHAEVIRV